MRHRPTRRGDPSSDLATAAPKSFLHEYRHVSYWLARNDRGMWRWSLAGETTGGAAFYTREQAEAAAKHHIDCLHECPEDHERAVSASRITRERCAEGES